MAKNKTNQTEVSVTDFINLVDDEVKRSDSLRLIEIIQDATGFEPKMWGPSIIGFGTYHYKYDSGHEGDMCLVGFSPRKPAISLYIGGFPGKDELLKHFGKYKAKETGGCIYVKKLADINTDVLKTMVVSSVKETQQKYPG